MIKKLFKFFSFIFLFFVVLSSCSSTTVDENKYTLKIGMEDVNLPHNWAESEASEENIPAKGKSGEYVSGYDVRIAKFICEDNNWDLELIVLDFPMLLPSLKSGVVNAVISGLGDTEERRKSVDFTDPYYTPTLCFVSKSDDERFNYDGNYFDIEQKLEGLKLIGLSGSVQESIIKDWEDKYKCTVLEGSEDFSAAILYLKQGITDAVFLESNYAKTVVASNPDLKIVDFDNSLIDDKFTHQIPSYIAIEKGDPDNIEDKINASLSKLDEGTRNRWMEEETEKIIEINRKKSSATTLGEQINSLLKNYGATFGYGVLCTLLLALLGTGVGLLLGIFLNEAREIKINRKDKVIVRFFKRFAQIFAHFYVVFFKGTPLMVQAMILFALSPIWTNISAPNALGNFLNGYMLCGSIIIIMNTAAYMSETVKAGMNSIDKGQIEAAESLGLSSSRTLWNIKLPQAIKNCLPSIGNDFIVNIKNSSVLNVIGLTELFRSVSIATKTNYFTIAGYIIVAIIYLLLTLFFGVLFFLINNKLSIPEKVNWFGIRRTTIKKIKLFFKKLFKKDQIQDDSDEDKIMLCGTNDLVTDIEKLRIRQRKERRHGHNRQFNSSDSSN